MSYKTLLVQLDNENHALSTLQVAIALAEQHDSHLIGTYILHPVDMYVSLAGEISVSENLHGLLFRQELDRIERLKTLFLKHTSSVDIIAEWRTIDHKGPGAVKSLLGQTSTVDLLIVGAKEPEPSITDIHDMPESVLIGSSRPVMVVPLDYEVGSIGRFVFAAWDGSRESSRAIFDSLALLQQADSVWVHRINPPNSNTPRVAGLTEELANTLSRHGVAVEVSYSEASHSQIGKELLGIARDRGADVMVMGAYGHSRIHELFLGGVTRNVLQHMNVPIMMSH